MSKLKSESLASHSLPPILFASHLFSPYFRVVGVGYKARAEAEGRRLFLKLGYSHEFELVVPPAVRIFCLKNNTLICCTGIDKQSQFAATVCDFKPPECYKGKGILFKDELIKIKPGKKNRPK